MVKKITKLVVFLIVFAIILSFTGALGAQDDTYEMTSQDKVILAQSSVCFVTSYFIGYVLDPWDNVWSEQYYQAYVGTGFCVSPDTGHIVTAGHMVEISAAQFKYDLIYEYLIDYYGYLDGWTQADWDWAYENIKVEGYDGGDYDLEVYVQFNTANAGIPDDPSIDDSYIRAELIDFSGFEQRDIAILRIQPQTGRALSSAILGDSGSVEIQDELIIIGYPWTSDIGQANVMSPTITNGNLSGKIMLYGTEVMQIQGSAREGNSGGPVLNQDGQVVGILTMGTDYANNYLRPSNDVIELMDRNGVTNSLGMVDEEFQQGLVNYRLNHFTEAIEYFNAVLNLNQRHLLAQDYRSKSQEAINKGEDVPIEEDTEVTIVDPETADSESVTETVSDSVDSPSGSDSEGVFLGLGIPLLIVLFAVVPLIFIALLAVIIILLVRKKKKVTGPPAAAASQVNLKPEGSKAKKIASESKKGFCSNCGGPLKSGAQFCINCGTKIE